MRRPDPFLIVAGPRMGTEVRARNYGMRAWTLLHKAREARREASRATSHREAEFALFACREYLRMARRANHQSIRARETPRRWTPPVLRELEAAA